ncbi:MAG: Clp protease ClpP [Blautia obeum]|nr:Clp protease ClpP [Blautia obeum]
MLQHKTKYRFEQLANGSAVVHKLYIYDEVRAQGEFDWNTWDYKESETSAKYFRDQLDAIPSGETIELHVNSVGGEVGEGVTIYNLLRQKAEAGSKLVGYVDGMAYSVAMVIIMACDEIHMGLGTSMFLHNPWTRAQGNADQLRSVADQLDALTDASVQLYMNRLKNMSEEELRQMMKKETMLAPDTCLEYGFCDFVGEKKPDDPEPGEPKPGNQEPDDPDNPEPDDPEDKVKQLKKLLFQEQQINQMLRGINKPSMKDTFSRALQQLTTKND